MASVTFSRSRFQPGHLCVTPRVQALIEQGDLNPLEHLQRHVCGDWGDISANDAKANECALRHHDQLVSAYRINDEIRLLIITESDRSVTTLLLGSEY